MVIRRSDDKEESFMLVVLRDLCRIVWVERDCSGRLVSIARRRRRERVRPRLASYLVLGIPFLRIATDLMDTLFNPNQFESFFAYPISALSEEYCDTHNFL